MSEEVMCIDTRDISFKERKESLKFQRKITTTDLIDDIGFDPSVYKGEIFYARDKGKNEFILCLTVEHLKEFRRRFRENKVIRDYIDGLLMDYRR